MAFYVTFLLKFDMPVLLANVRLSPVCILPFVTLELGIKTPRSSVLDECNGMTIQESRNLCHFAVPSRAWHSRPTRSPSRDMDSEL